MGSSGVMKEAKTGSGIGGNGTGSASLKGSSKPTGMGAGSGFSVKNMSQPGIGGGSRLTSSTESKQSRGGLGEGARNVSTKGVFGAGSGFLSGDGGIGSSGSPQELGKQSIGGPPENLG